MLLEVGYCFLWDVDCGWGLVLEVGVFFGFYFVCYFSFFIGVTDEGKEGLYFVGGESCWGFRSGV